MNTTRKILSVGALVLLGGCVSMPSGPAVMVLPGTGKSFDQFRADDMDCRQFASNQVGGNTPDSVAEQSGVRSAVVGTAIGAAAGAILGGQRGAATGAGAGLIIGGASGAGAAAGSQRGLQARYDNGYQQCMYARGHRVPIAGRFDGGVARRPDATYAPPAPPTSGAIPLPPSGSPPPPPPGYR
jgi:Glycine-zipper domain